MALGYSITAVDIHDGSELAVGYASLSQERGVRRFFVETTGANAGEWLSGTKKGAIDAVFAAHATHPEIAALPLQFARATKIGPRKFIVDQYWAWGSNSSWGGNSAQTLADFDVGTMGVPCYTCGVPEVADGLPSATVSGSTKWHRCLSIYDPTVPPDKYLFPAVVMKIRIPFQSNVSPLTTAVEALVNRTNSETCKILTSAASGSTLTLTAGKLMFIGARVTSRVNASYAFVGYYEFWSRRAWSQQNIIHTSGSWTVTKDVYALDDSALGSSKFEDVFGFPQT